MRLQRLIIAVYGRDLELEDKEFHFDDVQVRIQPVPGHPRTRLLVGTMALAELPSVDESERVLVPSKKLARCEYLLEAAANLVAVTSVTGRTLYSPTCCIGFVPDSDADRDWLNSKNGLEYGTKGRSTYWLRQVLRLEEVASQLLDRLDGVALFAEALSYENAAGRVRELVRVTERAFGRAGAGLIDPLANFLRKGPYDYTRDEVGAWFEVRGGLSHADFDALNERHALDVLARVDQAARDVLLNKRTWQTASPARRQVWSPSAWISKTGVVAVERSPPITVETVMLDYVGSYRVAGIGMAKLPDGWWPPPPPPPSDG